MFAIKGSFPAEAAGQPVLQSSQPLSARLNQFSYRARHASLPATMGSAQAARSSLDPQTQALLDNAGWMFIFGNLKI